jgi:hypothetical protein
MALVNIGADSKTELLSRIRRAKSSHIRWRAFAQGLVAGVKVNEERLPVMHADCQFGQWYYGEGRALLGQVAIFNDIEGPHEMLHAVYAKVYQLVCDGHTAKARSKLDELVAVSRTLIEQIELLEAEIDAIF